MTSQGPLKIVQIHMRHPVQTNQNALQTTQNSYKQTKILTNKPKL